MVKKEMYNFAFDAETLMARRGGENRNDMKYMLIALTFLVLFIAETVDMCSHSCKVHSPVPMVPTGR